MPPPGHLTGVLLRTVGNLTQNEARLVGHLAFVSNRPFALRGHVRVTFKRLTRYKQKVVFAAMLEGKSMPSNMAANTNHTTLLKNQSAIK